MDEEALIALLAGPFHAEFAATLAARVRAAGAEGTLYAVATGGHERLSSEKRHRVLFRSAYVLDRIFLSDPACFAPYAESFCRTDFAACTDPSARRHLTKIMAALLGRYTPPDADLERIAAAAAEWAVDPEAKVAVRIGAVEVLRACRGKVGWVEELWEDLLETLAHDATPGIDCRMRKRWRSSGR